jgi:hypothetical protein
MFGYGRISSMFGILQGLAPPVVVVMLPSSSLPVRRVTLPRYVAELSLFLKSGCAVPD